MVLDYKKGNMFEKLDKDIIYLQACNAQGHWGAGVALEFKKYFPLAYRDHKKMMNRTGDGYLLDNNGYTIACLITSEFYGVRKDSPKKILIQTYLALYNLFRRISYEEIKIYSPKINSGFFNTPWEATEKVILRVCKKTNKNINWTVWEI